jgi:chemosensory pili system protein ChpA (sensor histidine kinase/response regulator)
MTQDAPSVMVVDDDEDIREVAKLVLEAEGHRVTTAADGLDAWRQLEAGESPSVILLDLMMPRMDGEQFIRSLRASARAGIPVVIMSGHSAASVMARELEAHACLTKPIELEDLLETVRRFARAEDGFDPSTAR